MKKAPFTLNGADCNIFDFFKQFGSNTSLYSSNGTTSFQGMKKAPFI